MRPLEAITSLIIFDIVITENTAIKEMYLMFMTRVKKIMHSSLLVTFE